MHSEGKRYHYTFGQKAQINFNGINFTSLLNCPHGVCHFFHEGVRVLLMVH